MKQKSILIIGNYPPPYGGVPHHIERLSEYLVEKGWSCNVLSGGTTGYVFKGALTVYKPTYGRKLLAIVRKFFDRKYIGWLASGSLNRDEPEFWRRYLMYADVGEKIIRENDVQLIVSYNLLAYAPVGAWLADEYGIPHVINIFGEVYKYDSMERNRSFFECVAKGATRLLSCSDHCGNSVKKLGIQNIVHTVTYGVNITHFTPGVEPPALRARLGFGPEPVALFIGRLSKEMGLDSFLEAARLVSKRVENVRFVMVGQAGDMADEVEQACKVLGGRFVLVRNAPYDDLPDYYRMAKIVVVPTRGNRTCSSLAAMEAMATCRPVIGFAIGGIPEIIEHEKTGLLVEPENAEALAGNMLRLFEDELLCCSLADAGYQQAQLRFDERLVNVTMERHFLDALGAA